MNNHIWKLYWEGEKVIISQHLDWVHLNLAENGLDKVEDAKKAICTILSNEDFKRLTQQLWLEEFEEEVAEVLKVA